MDEDEDVDEAGSESDWDCGGVMVLGSWAWAASIRERVFSKGVAMLDGFCLLILEFLEF